MSKEKTQTKTVMLSLRPEDYARLKELADADHRPAGQMARLILLKAMTEQAA